MDDPGGTNGTEDGGQEQRKRDAQFWYEDGTVILVAHDVEFRVYKGVLVHHSLFFRDMFSLPQPPDAASEPCPTVHLFDSPEDIRYMLQASMTPASPSLFRREEPSFDLISACVRIAHKYQMERLMEACISHLKSYYTSDLETWQQRCYQEYDQVFLPGFSHPHAIGVVNLAHLTGESSLLPTAFLQCHTLQERIFDGFERADGSYEGLALADLKRCIKAKGRIAAASLAIYVRMYRASVSDHCATPDACLSALQAALTLLDWYSDIVTEQDPFRPPLRLYEVPEDIVLCSRCADLAVERGREAQEEFWKELPRIFDIQVDGW